MLLKNISTDNNRHGFTLQLSSNSNTVIKNLAENNGGTDGSNGVGFELNSSSGNTLSKNTANNNSSNGFFAFFASELNTFTENQGCGNFFFDALDQSTGVGNVWEDNDFCTSSGI